MAISSSLWFVLLSFAGVVRGGGKVSFKLGALEDDSFNGPNRKLTITFEKDGAKKTNEISSTHWTYQCFSRETKLEINLVLNNADAKITAIHAAMYNNNYKKLTVSEDPNQEFGSEEVEEEFIRICAYQGSWYPKDSNDPTIYVKLDHGIARTLDINSFVFILKVEGKVLKMKIIKSVIGSFVKEKTLSLMNQNKSEADKLMNSMTFTEFGKGVSWLQLILKDLNCELQDPKKLNFEINKITINQEGEGIFAMPIFTKDISFDSVIDTAVTLAKGGPTSVATNLVSVKCIENGISYMPSDETAVFYQKITDYCRGKKLNQILL